MLRKKERLTRALFDRSFSVGTRYHSPYLQVIVAASSGFHGSVVVGKKVYKKAVDRNQLRRRLYAGLYSWQKSKMRNATYIIIAKPPISTVSKKVVGEELREVLGRTPLV